jgi:hypothetical protein
MLINALIELPEYFFTTVGEFQDGGAVASKQCPLLSI